LKFQVTGPYFFDENVTGEMHHSVLQIFLCLMSKDIPLVQLQELILQRAGAPAHFATIFHDFFNCGFQIKVNWMMWYC
jgi:hypothetical protein